MHPELDSGWKLLATGNPGLRPGLTYSVPSGLEDLNFAIDLWNLR